MPKRRGFVTVLKYAAGIAALSVSVAAAWFLPGLYAGWQDQQMEGRVVLSGREGIQFLDTTSLDIARRLQMLEEMEQLNWTWGHSVMTYADIETPFEEVITRCHRVMENWCAAGLFPEGCLDILTLDHLVFPETLLVYLNDVTLPVYCFHFYGDEGYEVTAVVDASIDMIYYASVNGWAMMDEVSADLGFESFGAMAEYERKLLEEQGLDVAQFPEFNADAYIIEECGRLVRSADELPCDFAAVCGAREEHISRDEKTMGLDVELSFDTFTGHAYRRISAIDYMEKKGRSIGAGFAVMYGTLAWQEIVMDYAAMYGNAEEMVESVLYWYETGLEYVAGDPLVTEILRDYPGTTAQVDVPSDLPDGEGYDAEETEIERPASQAADSYEGPTSQVTDN